MENRESGIFEPKAPQKIKGASDAQKALRFLFFLAAVVLGALLYLLLRNPELRPVKKYYKGLDKQDVDLMCEAFPPGW